MPRKTNEQRQAETRMALVGAAVSVFTVRGYHAASLDEISEQAGYSTGAVYSNFAGKEGLFLACLDHTGARQIELWEKFFARAEESGVDEGEIAAAIESVLLHRGWRRAVLEFGIAPKSDHSQSRFLASQQGWRRVVQRMLEAIASGNSMRPALSFETGAELVSSVFDGLAAQDMDRTDHELGVLVAVTVRLVLSEPASSNEVHK